MSKWTKFRDQVKEEAKKFGDKVSEESLRIATQLSEAAEDAEEYINKKAEETERYIEEHSQKEFNSRLDKALKHKCEDLKIDAACQLLGITNPDSTEPAPEEL
ncbi:MAG: hypothetical protein RLN62_05335 [Rickettsiales bacterium]